MKKFAIYIRVSTQKQGRSGLGLESQQKICNEFITSNNGECVAEFKDVESGTHRDRKGLWNAIEFCNKNHCPLVIATLSRLARDVEFCFKVVNTGIEIHFCDMPTINTLLLGVFASVAQYERELTSDRTRKALAVKKAQGCKLGASSEKYQETYNKKNYAEKHEFGLKRGDTRNARYTESREVQAFLRVLRNIFPNVCVSDDASEWDWAQITTRGEYKHRIICMMKDYKTLDESGEVFGKWDFDNWDEKYLLTRLCAHIQNVRTAFKRKRI